MRGPFLEFRKSSEENLEEETRQLSMKEIKRIQYKHHGEGP
jgi:hypothetical protein